MEERPVNQSIAKEAGTIDDIHLYIADEENRLYIYRVICSFLRNANVPFFSDADLKDAAFDVLQNTLLTAVAKADSFQGGNAKAWIRAIALNHVKKMRTNIFNHSEHESSLENVYEPAANLSESHHLFFDDPQLAIGEQEQIQMALACLSPEDQMIVLLQKRDGLTCPEIADRLGLSPGAVRVRSSRALRQVRAAWQQLENGKGGENNE